ncbi:ZIP family metal transporter [Candidatus Woesearchaeota archaeon]|nr:ZIP family metal transporter [Candidatus Woesearchaeota archaeon]
MTVWFNTIFSVLIVSLISLIGIITFALKAKKMNNIALFLVSFAAGSLFGGAFIHLLPESAEEMGFGIEVSLYALLGIVIFFLLENVIHWRHCHIPTSEEHPHPFGLMNLVGDGFHNLIDGMVIAASYMASVQLGIATTLAVILHEIPQEIGDFGVLIHAGYSKVKALFFNFLSALTAILGAIIVLFLGSGFESFTLALLPFTAGGFIYIAGSDLIPELKKACYPLSRVALQFLALILGIAVMLLLAFLEF